MSSSIILKYETLRAILKEGHVLGRGCARFELVKEPGK